MFCFHLSCASLSAKLCGNEQEAKREGKIRDLHKMREFQFIIFNDRHMEETYIPQ